MKNPNQIIIAPSASFPGTAYIMTGPVIKYFAHANEEVLRSLGRRSFASAENAVAYCIYNGITFHSA